MIRNFSHNVKLFRTVKMNLPIALMVINGIHFAYSGEFYPTDFFIKGPTSRATIYGVDGSEIQSVADAGSISSQGIKGATSSSYTSKSDGSDVSSSKDCDSDCAYKSGGSGVVIKGPSTSAVINGPYDAWTGNNSPSGTSYNQPSNYNSQQSHLNYGKSDKIATGPCDSTSKDCATAQIPLHILRTNSSATTSDVTIQSPSASEIVKSVSPSQTHYKPFSFTSTNYDRTKQVVTGPCAGQNCKTTQNSQEAYGLNEHSSPSLPNVIIQGPSTSAVIKGPHGNGVALGKNGAADTSYETSPNQVDHNSFHFASTNYEKSQQIGTGPCDSSGKNCGISQNPIGSNGLNTHSNLGGWAVIKDTYDNTLNTAQSNKPSSFPSTTSGGVAIHGPSTSTFIKSLHGSSVLADDSDKNQNNYRPNGLSKYSNIRSSTADIQGPSTSAFVGKYSPPTNPFGTHTKSNVVIQGASTSSIIKDSKGNAIPPGDNPALESNIKKYAIPATLVYSGSSGIYKQQVPLCDPSYQRCDDTVSITEGNKALGNGINKGKGYGIGTLGTSSSSSSFGQNTHAQFPAFGFGHQTGTSKSSFSNVPYDNAVFTGSKSFKNYDIKYNVPAGKGYFESSSFAPPTYSKPDNSPQSFNVYQNTLPSSSKMNTFTWESKPGQGKNLGYNCYVFKYTIPGHVVPSEYSTLLNKISRSVANDFEHYSEYHQPHYDRQHY